jgi:hypothetical protein
MKKFKIKQIVPASVTNTFIIEAATPEEAYAKLINVGGEIVSTTTHETLEDVEYDYPEEI